MKKSGILIIFILFGFMLACTYDTIAPRKVEVPENISFDENVIPIFNKSCNVSGCHSNNGISPNLSANNAYISLTFFGYVDTDFPEESKIYIKTTIGSMNQYATDQDRAIILKWIEQGAPDN